MEKRIAVSGILLLTIFSILNNTMAQKIDREMDSIQSIFKNILIKDQEYRHALYDVGFSSVNCESQEYNPYLNRKLYINSAGFIFNDCTSRRKLGEIFTVFLRGISLNDNANILWEVSKNKIKKCKDCEYRYMCFDRRIPQKDKEKGYYYFEKDCSYDPYKCTWKDLGN